MVRKNNKLTFALSVLITFTINCSYAQSILQSSIFLDENSLVSGVGTTISQDASANNGNCMFRAMNTSNGTVWFGPYFHIQGGNYLIQFRLKVGSNISSNNLCFIDIVSSSGGVIYNRLNIKPNMFKISKDWTLITIPVKLSDNINDFEIRCMDFQKDITDLYFDYIQIVPNAIKGIYTEDFTVSDIGNVGIGTTTPDSKLAVNGTIHSKEVKVDMSGWPDYVFRKEYDLKTLKEVEKQIYEKGHLENIPSEEEVLKNGLNLGEMNSKLLQKIEELTLYIIEQEKKTEKLNLYVIEQNKRIERLEKQNNKILEK
jgi:hypothetical protein